MISVTALEKRNAIVELPSRVRMEWEKTKLSQNTFENIWFVKLFAEHIRLSLKLQVIHLVGFKLCRSGWRHIGEAVEDSLVIRSLVL